MWREDVSNTNRSVTVARNHIKALIGGAITLKPTKDGGLVAEMQGDYAGLVALAEKSPGTKGSRAKRKSKLSLVAGARSHLYRTRITTRKKAGP